MPTVWACIVGIAAALATFYILFAVGVGVAGAVLADFVVGFVTTFALLRAGSR